MGDWLQHRSCVLLHLFCVQPVLLCPVVLLVVGLRLPSSACTVSLTRSFIACLALSHRWSGSDKEFTICVEAHMPVLLPIDLHPSTRFLRGYRIRLDTRSCRFAQCRKFDFAMAQVQRTSLVIGLKK